MNVPQEQGYTGDQSLEHENLEPQRILHIEMDEVPEVSTFVQEVASLSVGEQIQRTSDFIKFQFKNAISPSNRSLPPEEQEKIRKIFDQSTPKKLSECLGGYGVCVEYHVLGKNIFDKLGIPAEFKTVKIEGGPSHTYLDIEVDGAWQIFDPFAEVYLSDAGNTRSRLFSSDYYKSSRTVSTE